jgi:molybdate transport system substrate-binding protein
MHRLSILLCGMLLTVTVQAEPLRMAVAANFQDTFEALRAAYAAQGGEAIEPSYGATGTLYTQIVNGAPFAAFFAADDQRSNDLISANRAVPASRFIYAIGHLALWTPGTHDAPGPDWLADATHRIAIANPELAPYGRAAQETLSKLDLWQALGTRLVTGASVAQAFQFTASGGADGGFVGTAQLRSHFHRAVPATEVWYVPQNLYTPIVQEAVALDAKQSRRTQAFFDFVTSAAGREIIEDAGYSVLAPIKPPTAALPQ